MVPAASYLTCSEAGRLAEPPLTPAAIRAAATRGQLRVAATTATGVRLFTQADVETYLHARAQRRKDAA